MSLLDYNEIPGFREAANREQMNRELAFMPAPLPLCGIPIRHLNARHHMLLCGCGNKFIVGGGRPMPEDVAMFLWFLSPEYVTDTKARDRFVKKQVARLNYVEAVVSIAQYVEVVFQDVTAAGSDAVKHYFAPVASIVDLLAHEYGWTDEEILEMALARVFQYVRRITQRYNPKTHLFNRSEGKVAEYLRKRMEPAAPEGTN